MAKHRKTETPKCPNGHDANSNGNCFDPNCVYNNSRKNEGHSTER